MSPRIGIIGAGPGGLSLARLLTEHGFADVTVIERDTRVGGKSLTEIRAGVGHELGTCYVADGYTTTKRWMDAAGMQIHPLTEHLILNRAGTLLPFKDFVEGDAGLLGTAAQTLRYVRAWQRFHAWDLRGNPDNTFDDLGHPMHEQVARPFGDWLRDRGLDTTARFAMRTMTIMGYGPLDRVPALYGLRWNVPSLILSALRQTVGEPVPGWQHLWIHVASHLDVRLGCAVSRVTREGTVFRVEVVSDGVSDTLEFDHLVLTGPLDEAAQWFPFTAEERAAWGIDGEVSWREYITTLVAARGWFRDADTRSFEAHAYDSQATALGRLLVARRTGDKTAVARSRSTTRDDVYVCYQYGDRARSDAEVQGLLWEDLGAQGAHDLRRLSQHRWRYAPQWSADAIRSGALARAERQQGRNGLWVSGATASHEAVDNIVDYNERLVERMSASFRGEDPGNPELLDRIADRLQLRLDDK